MQLKASNKRSSRTKKVLFLVSSIALVSSSSALTQASSSLHHSVAFHNGLSFFSRLNAHAWGGKCTAGSSDSGEGNAYSSISLKTPNTKVTPSNPVTPTTNSRARTPSIPDRLLDESAAAGAAAAAATGAGSESFTLGGLLEKDRQAVTTLPPAPSQDIEMDKEVLEELTRMLYQSLNERQQDVWAKLWLNDDQGGGGSSVMLSAGDGNVTVGHAGVVDWLNVLRKEERKLDPGKKGLMLCPTTEISNVRVCVNGLHAWVTCHEVLTRGLLKDGGEGKKHLSPTAQADPAAEEEVQGGVEGTPADPLLHLALRGSFIHPLHLSPCPTCGSLPRLGFYRWKRTRENGGYKQLGPSLQALPLRVRQSLPLVTPFCPQCDVSSDTNEPVARGGREGQQEREPVGREEEEAKRRVVYASYRFLGEERGR